VQHTLELPCIPALALRQLQAALLPAEWGSSTAPVHRWERHPGHMRLWGRAWGVLAGQLVSSGGAAKPPALARVPGCTGEGLGRISCLTTDMIWEKVRALGGTSHHSPSAPACPLPCTSWCSHVSCCATVFDVVAEDSGYSESDEEDEEEDSSESDQGEEEQAGGGSQNKRM
jgi:hypothetical protein